MRLIGNREISRTKCGAITVASVVAFASPAFAQDSPSVAEQVRTLERELAAQRDLVAQQGARLAEQQKELDALQQALHSGGLADLRGAGFALPSGQAATPGGGQLPPSTVGEAPAMGDQEVQARVEAIPQEQGVLTPPGILVFDPSVEYTRSSRNRLVFRGIELIPGIQIGLIEATDADRDTIAGTVAFRYGLMTRLEVEARVPMLYRQDRIEVAQQRDEGIVRQIGLREEDFGDVEFGARYQFNAPKGQRPIWVGSLRLKTRTGKSPFEVGYDEFGVATGLATGSGFWALQPGLSFLLPSDPVVIFGGGSYLWHIPRNVDRLVGETLVGRVDPGDAVSANLGFGFALNPRFSYSLGYRHSYIFKTKSEIGETVQRSKSLHVASLNLGLSYRLTERRTINFGFEFGVTSDAPDVSITIRMPLAFDARGRRSR